MQGRGCCVGFVEKGGWEWKTMYRQCMRHSCNVFFKSQSTVHRMKCAEELEERGLEKAKGDDGKATEEDS